MKDLAIKTKFLFSLLDLKKVKYLFALLVLAAILEGFGISLVVPALSLIMGTENEITSYIYQYIPEGFFTSSYILLFFLFSVYIIKNLIVVFTGWFEIKISRDLKIQITDILFDTYLSQPFSITAKSDSPSIIRNINSLAQSLIILGQTILGFIADILFIIAVVTVLLFSYTKVTIILTVTFFIIIFAYAKIFGKFIKKWSYVVQSKQKNLFQNVQESIDSLKEIKLMHLGSEFKKTFNSTVVAFFDHQKKISFYGNLGRPVVEIFGILVLSIFLIIILGKNFKDAEIFNFLALFTFVMLRILPVAAKIINVMNKMNSQIPTITILHEVLKDTKDKKITSYEKIENINTIELKNISFGYNPKTQILNNVDFKIQKGELTAIIGESGSGKSTFLSILSGLHNTNEGTIFVNDNKTKSPLYEICKIGYIPQRPLLINRSIKTNICITENPNEIDNKKLAKVIEQACLENVVDKFEEGLETIIGEKSGKISGGEAQRIAIARALYTGSQIMFLDEPTSSLDPNTEERLMRNIKDISKYTITIITSHKINLLNYCNAVYKMENKKIHKINKEVI